MEKTDNKIIRYHLVVTSSNYRNSVVSFPAERFSYKRIQDIPVRETILPAFLLSQMNSDEQGDLVEIHRPAKLIYRKQSRDYSFVNKEPQSGMLVTIESYTADEAAKLGKQRIEDLNQLEERRKQRRWRWEQKHTDIIRRRLDDLRRHNWQSQAGYEVAGLKSSKIQKGKEKRERREANGTYKQWSREKRVRRWISFNTSILKN